MYVFTRLNKVYDAMPSTKSHSNKLFPRPPTPFDGKRFPQHGAHLHVARYVFFNDSATVYLLRHRPFLIFNPANAQYNNDQRVNVASKQACDLL